MIFNKHLIESKSIESNKGIRYIILDNLFDEDFILKCEKEFLEIKIVKSFNPKVLESILQHFYFFSNKFIINIKKKEYFNN